MSEKRDIIIIGTGPAGICTADTAVSAGYASSVTMIEKREKDSYISCAEGVGYRSFHECLDIREEWIRCRVHKAIFKSPSGIEITYKDKYGGYILDRKQMQSDMINALTDQGVELISGETAIDVSKPGPSGKRSVILSSGSEIEAEIIIDASGPLSRIGRDTGIQSRCDDLEAAIYSIIEGPDFPCDSIKLQTGMEIAPGGYAWVFPRNDGYVNAGIVIGSRYKKYKNIKTLLNRFIDREYPGMKILETKAGVIPSYTRKRRVAVPGLLKAGDAACTVNPVSRAGITEAMKSGILAGNAAVEQVSGQYSPEKACKRYQKDLYKKLGKVHKSSAGMKKVINRIPDTRYDRSASKLSRIPQEKLTMTKIFSKVIGPSPRVLWALKNLI